VVHVVCPVWGDPAKVVAVLAWQGERPRLRWGRLVSDEESIGARIRRCRRARGLSLDQAAGLAGISKPYLSRLERGDRSVDSRSLLLRIAGALEVSVTDLTGQPYVPRDREHADAQRGGGWSPVGVVGS
jgi:DNA-binding XRE family transcriptional regulator